jgi:hypothetical protein
MLMMASSEALMERLVLAVPALRPWRDQLREELRQPDLRDALPQFLLEKATRELTARAVGGDGDALAELTTIAELLEAEFGSGEEVDHMISSCFVILLPYPWEPGGDLVRLLGPKLTAELRQGREWRTPPAQVAFVDRLVRAVPALAPLVEENRAGNHRDVLTHPFLGDVARREVDNHLSGDAAARAEVTAVLRHLEAELNLDEEVDDPIAVSFVENLPYDHEPGADIAGLLGPKLTAELHRQRPWTAGRSPRKDSA